LRVFFEQLPDYEARYVLFKLCLAVLRVVNSLVASLAGSLGVCEQAFVEISVIEEMSRTELTISM